MNQNAFMYVRGYILKNYPMYSDKILSVRNDFLPFLVDSIHKEYGLKSLNQGMADEKIDQLISDYIRDNFDDEMWNSFNNLCEYVKSILTDKYNSWIDMISDELLNFIVKDVVLSVIDADDFEYSKYMDGSYNQKFLVAFEQQSDKFYDTCCNHIKRVLIDNDVDRNYSDSTYNYLLHLMMLEMLKVDDIKNFKSGIHDNLIISKYMKTLKKAKNDVRRYVRDVIYEKEFLLGTSVDDVFKYIEYAIFTTGKFNIEDLLNGELDNYIVDYVNSKKKSIDINDIKIYIFRIIQSSNGFDLSNQELLQIADNILNILYSNNCSLRDIQIGRHDSDIKKILDRIMMKRFSIENDNSPKKVKHKTKKKKMPFSLKNLIITAVCVSVLVPGAYFVKDVVDSARYIAADYSLSKFDDYPYTWIYSPDNDMVFPTAVNALDFYNKVKESGIDDNDVYCYLGFHTAYSYASVGQDILYVMDEILDNAQSSCMNNEEYSDVYGKIKNYSCFLEFAMDRLYDMGYESIRDDKYVEALNAYKDAQRKSIDETPMDIISDDHYKIVEDIMDKYGKYCRKATVEFSNLLPEIEEEKTVEKSSLSVQSGRKI